MGSLEIKKLARLIEQFDIDLAYRYPQNIT